MYNQYTPTYVRCADDFVTRCGEKLVCCYTCKKPIDTTCIHVILRLPLWSGMYPGAGESLGSNTPPRFFRTCP